MLRAAQVAGLSPTPLARLRHQVRDSQLVALSATVSGGAIAAAARQLAIAAPVVSRALAQLTHAIEQPLYRRAGNGVEPTRAARELAAGYELLQSEVRQGLEEIRELRGIYDGLLSLGALPTARASWLPRSLEALLEEYPDVPVTIMDGPYEEQLSALRQGRIDLIMGALRHPLPGGDLVQEAIFHDTLSLVCRAGHPMQRLRPGRGTRIDRRALARYRWMLPPAGTPAREQLSRLLAAQRLPQPARVLECNSFLTIRELLLHSDSIAVVSTSQVASDIVQSRLCILGPDLPHTSHEVGWTMRAAFKPTELLRAFLKCARARSPARP
jgi:DNA-binding transcriptional LysR family regulator